MPPLVRHARKVQPGVSHMFYQLLVTKRWVVEKVLNRQVVVIAVMERSSHIAKTKVN